MEPKRRTYIVYALLATVWALVVVWQAEEHLRFKGYTKVFLRNRSKDIANTIGAAIRGSQFRGRGAVFRDPLERVLRELVNTRTNELFKSAEVLGVALLNAAGERVAEAGRPIDLEQKDILQEGERWGRNAATFIYPVAGMSVADGGTNASVPVLIPPRPTNDVPPPSPSGIGPHGPGDHGQPDHEHGPPDHPPGGWHPGEDHPPPPDGDQPRLPRWARARGISSEEEYQSLLKKIELHWLALTMSLDTFDAAVQHDFWLRLMVAFFATVSALGSAIAARNMSKTSDLQIRLVRASELTSHLKEMNLAAAGLAHETRNPLNIIRGLAQMISKQEDCPTETRQKSRDIINEADKVTAQLNEFINYSRPREVRRTRLAINSVVTEVVRTLTYDLEEKKIALEMKVEALKIEADEQLLRQALFNLLLNATQAVNGSGQIQVIVQRTGAAEAALEVRDNGPGVPAAQRDEIFKPYFTTQKTGTGLGLAVVQQIILAHGWEIKCLPNDPKGAIFRITHLKVAEP